MDVAKFLINSGIETDLVGKSSWTPLHLAVFKNHIDIVKYLIDHGKANINAKDDEGWNPLLMAVSNSNIELVKYLINCGAQVEKSFNNQNQTLIHVAADKGKIEIVKFLIENGAVVDAKCNLDCTPLFLAAQKGMINL